MTSPVSTKRRTRPKIVFSTKKVKVKKAGPTAEQKEIASLNINIGRRSHKTNDQFMGGGSGQHTVVT